MTTYQEENAALTVYASALCSLTKKGVPFDLADKVAEILERQSIAGSSYQRTPEEQEIINQVWEKFTK